MFTSRKKKSVWSNDLQKKIAELDKAGNDLLRIVHKMKSSLEPICKNCRFYEVLNDPNHPDVTNLCICDEVLNMKMQPEPHPNFGCKFFKAKKEHW